MTAHQKGIRTAHIDRPGLAALWKSLCLLGCMLMLAAPQAHAQLELVIGTGGEISVRNPGAGTMTLGGLSLQIPTGTFHETGGRDFSALIATNGSNLAIVSEGVAIPGGASVKLGFAVTYTSLAGASVDFNDPDGRTINGNIVVDGVTPPTTEALQLVIRSDGEMSVYNPNTSSVHIGAFRVQIPAGGVHETGPGDFVDPNAIRSVADVGVAFVTPGSYDIAPGAWLKIGAAVGNVSLAGAYFEYLYPDNTLQHGIIVRLAGLELVIATDGEMSVHNPGTGTVRLGGFSLEIPTGTFRSTGSSEFSGAITAFNGSKCAFMTTGHDIAAGASLKLGAAVAYGSLEGAHVEFKDPGGDALAGSFVAIPIDLPTLSLLRYAGQVRLSWPTSYSGFVLESTDSPSGSWSRARVTVTMAGRNFVATVNPSEPAQFYRLRRL